MNIINDVLNELEKRGANAPLGESAIRAVPPRRQLHVARYLLPALVLFIPAGIAAWYLGFAGAPAPVQSAVTSAAKAEAVLLPSSAVTAAIVSAPAETVATSGASGVPPAEHGLPGKPLLEVKNEEGRVAAPVHRKTARHKSQPADHPAKTSENVPAEGSATESLKKISPRQRAENEYSKANLAAQEGRANDALAGYEAALLIDSSYKEARRAWVGMLIVLKRNDEAEIVLQKGLKRDPHDASFAMLLARLQVERNDVPLALETLQKTLPYAEEQADYQAFVAAILQRQNRHNEAIAHYQIALKLAPNNGIWLMGIGISLQATQHTADARDAYQRALASNTLNPQLQAFVQAKLKEL